MTDDQEQDRPLDPGEDERVRRLLAELGTAPDASTMPPEVADRLEETLAGLVAERSGALTADSGTVVPLRRRWASRAAAAAAAVIVVGAGGVAAANLGLFSGGSETADTQAGGATSKAESLDESTTSPGAPSSRSGPVPTVTAARFDADVARVLRSGFLPLSDARSRPKASQQGAEADTRPAARCSGPPHPRTVAATPVLYDGQLAVLLVHPPREGKQLVEAWTCAGDRVLDSTRVPVTPGGSGQSIPGSTGLASPSPSP